ADATRTQPGRWSPGHQGPPRARPPAGRHPVPVSQETAARDATDAAALPADTAERPPATRAPRSVSVSWRPGEHRFDAVGSHAGRVIVLNAPHPEGMPATGFSPAELVLAGAGA